MRQSVRRWVERTLVWGGLAALVYAGGTIAYGQVHERYQSWRFDQAVAAAATLDAATVVPAREIQDGDVLGRIEIPRIGVSVMVLQGAGAGVLTVGAGHVPGTPLPGAGGNVAITAHRDTFFRALKDIRLGDRIQVATLSRTYEYVVRSTEIVGPEDTQVMESRGRPELTLITCYPFYFVGAAPKRFIVHATPLE